MDYLTTIGLETHVQLKTRSKMFCGCTTRYGAPPNANVCPVCLGYPGAMPVMNREAVRLTVISGLMIGSDIPRLSKFDRKSYFYPDMPKNYQISQYDEPLCVGGAVTIDVEGRQRDVSVTRIHLEEDVGKSMHFRFSSGVDFNRAGVPLMEIVSDPDMVSPDEAYAYLQSLRQILLYAGVSYCNLEEGNMRCDVNVSVRPEGQSELGTKAEIKNMNTFKGVFQALQYEVRRQTELLESGGRVAQETRRWDPDSGTTSSMRTKEDAHDYRYFPEPDLMPVVMEPETVAEWQAELPELPRARRERFVTTLGLPPYDAGVLVADKEVADFYEATVACCESAKAASNWIMTDMLRLLSEKAIAISEAKVTPTMLGDLIKLVANRTLNSNSAREVFADMFETGEAPGAIVSTRGLAQVSDSGAIEAFVEQALADNPKSVEDYAGGKKAALQFLVGQVMRLSRGKANPQMVGEMIRTKLAG